MSFDEEWASARASAAETVGTRLNQVGGAGGSSNVDLAVNQDKLGWIGHAAYELHSRLRSDGNHARASTSEAATMMTVNGFQTGAAMRTVHDTWNSQLNTLLDACAHISNHLDYSASSQAKVDQDIAASLSVSKINEYLQ
ncbi:hypothetical protein AMK26_00415 [Streptomyces sp. CB03234]|uniref:hypothetical protein n=1 Tax=Streptomyces sp. (strain CB03234) TaxID=1703937 RepID=UPI00093D6395|nr:hypothetical protein [Streptomyces sp. CB03234]OKK07598.1 hypothetical protein AMK26_00415 [Streptomyces sp. CB03234]